MSSLSAMLAVAGAGMDAQQRRVSVTTENLAHAQTTRMPDGGPYRRKDVVLEASPGPESFASQLRLAREGPGDQSLSSVRAARIVIDHRPGPVVYNPTHPDADTAGMVHMPNVNTVEEMTNLIDATRAYEANATVVTAARAMAQSALKIGA